jgi:hypothetical protein
MESAGSRGCAVRRHAETGSGYVGVVLLAMAIMDIELCAASGDQGGDMTQEDQARAQDLDR